MSITTVILVRATVICLPSNRPRKIEEELLAPKSQNVAMRTQHLGTEVSTKSFQQTHIFSHFVRETSDATQRRSGQRNGALTAIYLMSIYVFPNSIISNYVSLEEAVLEGRPRHLAICENRMDELAA